MKVLTLTHANLNRPMYVLAANVAGFHYNEPTKSVVVYCYPGATFPVRESAEDIKKMIETAQDGQGETNGK